MCIPKSCLQFQPEVSEKYKVPIYNLVFHFWPKLHIYFSGVNGAWLVIKPVGINLF